MKYILPFFLCLFIAVFSSRLLAQSVDICPAIPEGEFGVGTTIEVPILVSGFTDVAAYQFTIDFPADLLQLDEVNSPLNNTITNELPAGSLRVAWISQDGLGVDVADDGALLSLSFTTLATVSAPDISVTDSPIEIVVTGGVPQLSYGVSLCGVTYTPPPTPDALQLCPFGTVGPFIGGELVEVFFNTTNFTNITELGFSLSYNTSLMSFNSLNTPTPIAGLMVSETTPGQLSFEFATDVPEGLSLPDGANNFSFFFNILGELDVATIQVTDAVLPIQGQQMGNPNLEIRVCSSNGQTGSGTPDFCLSYPEGPYTVGQEIEVEVVVQNFREINLVDMPLSIDWGQLQLLDFETAGPIEGNYGMTTLTLAEGLRLIWLDWENAGRPIPDGDPIMVLRFRAETDMTALPLHIDPAIGNLIISNSEAGVDPIVVTICGVGFFNGVPANLVSSSYLDAAGDCSGDQGGDPMPGWTLELTDETGLLTFSTSAGGSGLGYLALPPGEYTYQWIPPTNIDAWAVCNPSGNLSITETENVIYLEGLATPALDCSDTYVHVSSTNLRPCFDNNRFLVNYGNYGPITAVDAYIDLQLPLEFVPLSATLDFALQPDGSYRFDLGDLSVGASGSFSITGQLDCDLLVGSTLCATAVIEPNGKDCATPGEQYQGGELQATAECLGDEIRFTVTNEGDGPSGPLGFVVVEDVVIYMESSVELTPGQQHQFNIPATGSTYRLEIDRPLDAPYLSHALAIEEGCGDGPISLGFVTALPLLDGDLWLDRYCQETTAAYDPNDKQALPKGVGDNQLIAPNARLDYKIRFQNTGNDTAFTVIIRDTIDTEVFDLNTLELGAASHDFFLRQRGGNALEFIFNNIQLPDSTIDEPGSHGYVHFSIDQLADLPDGTRLSNRAGIYFDFNPPIITNESWHIVGRDLLSTSVRNFNLTGGPVAVYPNPFEASLQFEHEDWPGTLTFELFDQLGRQIFSAELLHSGSRLMLPALPQGSYHYRLIHAQQLLQTGLLLRD